MATPDGASANSSEPATEQETRTGQALSISQILRLHNRERLLVEPMRWTNRHLQLLGCTIAPPTPEKELHLQRVFSNKDAYHLYWAFKQGWTPVHRSTALRRLLSNLYFGYSNSHVVFEFGPREWTDYIHFPSFYSNRHQEGVLAAYVDLQLIQNRRNDLVERGRGCQIRKRLRQLKIKAITPQNCLHDPVVVAVLIALAQQNTYYQKTFSQVIATSDDRDRVFIYKSHIAPFLLRCLEDPNFTPPEPLSISIEVETIRFKPFRSFRDRLHANVFPSQHQSAVAKAQAERGKDLSPLTGAASSST
ncbi:hypothetical protein HIM_10190 [Hirsutella minnesotensis 3608]|uniref:Uncharacterized protein n=1 Tax=Hirsutella minnesotensis 3608 TaxID=1043627 RepID=A0A0F7ZXB3_9HYPO|nr:hypothetical protein HIM_10190 [Hirsutella minnesotensis 3608]